MAIPGSALETNHGPLDPGQASAVSRAVDGLTPEQLTWVSGYLAGLAAGRSAAAGAAPAAASSLLHAGDAEAAAAVDGGQALTVLYGSQTGNGRAVAEQLAEAARSRGFTVTCTGMQDYRAADLRKERNLLIIVSTHGEGDPPDDAEALHTFLGSRRAPRLETLHYSVLALGDSSYEHFCQTGRDFDERLAALGAQRIHERIDCDVDYEDPAARWTEAVLEEVGRRTGASANSALRSVGAPRPPVQLRAVDSTPRHGKANPFHAELLANQRITGRGSDWVVHHVELLLEGSGLEYLPGDALGVQPRNPEPLVAQILEALGADGDEQVEVAGGTARLAEALAGQLEVTVLTRGFLEQYAQAGRIAGLEALLAPEQREALAAWMAGRQVIDVLREYPAELPPGQVAGMLRRLTPRLYSIASSPLASPGEVHLTVARVRYHAFGSEHFGAASSWLADSLAEGDRVPVYVQPNQRFRLPVNGDAPVIMVGPGTGVAPFRAFVEHRQALGQTGRSWLFFGARHFDTDFLYQLEWLRHLRQGGLSRLDVAFSRDQSQKVYVQHRMLERGRDLYAWLEEGAHFYVCGDASRMAGDVHRALLDIVAREGGRSPGQAEAYVQALKEAGRYQRDVY